MKKVYFLYFGIFPTILAGPVEDCMQRAYYCQGQQNLQQAQYWFLQALKSREISSFQVQSIKEWLAYWGNLTIREQEWVQGRYTKMPEADL